MNSKNITTEGGIRRLTQPGGRTLAWAEGTALIEQDGFVFKDLEKTGELLPYEDWRLPDAERAADLASRLTIEQIAGLMLFSPHQAVPPHKGGPFQGHFGGKTFEESGAAPDALSDEQQALVRDNDIRNILLTSVDSAEISARWTNNLQKLAESLPHGIPVNISSDPRNGANASKEEYRLGGGDVSKWPEGVGFAACFDDEVVKQFAEDASREYRALGITTALGPQIDLCTEPRWMRFTGTLGMDTEGVKRRVKYYCDGMQSTLDADGQDIGWGRDSVNTMVKHWPGGGSGEGGRDAHYAFGKYAVYPGNNAAEHLKPFTEAAFKLDGKTGCAAAVMPYYTVSWGMDPSGQNVGNSYSSYIINDLLRGKYAFEGVVCTDWGITKDPDPRVGAFGSRCYGVEDLTEAERCLRIIMNGVDQFGGNSESAPVIEAYRIGCGIYGEDVMRMRYEASAARLLMPMFRTGLFEDPYLDPAGSAAVVGCEEFRRHGYEAQLKSVILLKNKAHALPLKKGIKVFIPQRKISESMAFFRTPVPAYTEDPVADSLIAKYAQRVDNPEEADAAIVFITSPKSCGYDEKDLESGGNGYVPVTLQYRPYTAKTARAVSIAGGDFREASANRSYRNKTGCCCNEADLDNILDCRARMAGKPVIVCALLENPTIPAEFEPSSDAVVADFGVSRQAVLDVVFGDHAPTGRLPVQMPADMETVEAHCEDIALDLKPYTDSEGNIWDFGFGLNY